MNGFSYARTAIVPNPIRERTRLVMIDAFDHDKKKARIEKH